ncbi:DUF3658 domain-containing protein [Methylocystis parvus]|nr:DUF3658 domain-containing protein [Methylocystis parvus]WBK01289.1 hypothetical protein MMG94_06135 [Methylocystis parvus OBBP]
MNIDKNNMDNDKIIDAAIMSCTEYSWKKTALIIERVLKTIREEWSDQLIDRIICRIRQLEKVGNLEISGDVSLLRSSEIRLTYSLESEKK